MDASGRLYTRRLFGGFGTALKGGIDVQDEFGERGPRLRGIRDHVVVLVDVWPQTALRLVLHLCST